MPISEYLHAHTRVTLVIAMPSSHDMIYDPRRSTKPKREPHSICDRPQSFYASAGGDIMIEISIRCYSCHALFDRVSIPMKMRDRPTFNITLAHTEMRRHLVLVRLARSARFACLDPYRVYWKRGTLLYVLNNDRKKWNIWRHSSS